MRNRRQEYVETAAASTLPAAPFIFSMYWQSFSFIFCPSFQFKNIVSSHYCLMIKGFSDLQEEHKDIKKDIYLS